MDRNWKIHTYAYGDILYDSETPQRVSVKVNDLPVTAFRLFFRSRAPDEVRLTVETDDRLVDPSQVWEYFAFDKRYWFSCNWISENDVWEDRPMFLGTLVKMTPSDTGDSGSAEMVFLGGWYYLQQIIFADNWLTLDGYGPYWGPVRDLHSSSLCANVLIRCALFRAQFPRGSGINYLHPNNDPNDSGTLLYSSVDVSDLSLPPMAFNSNTCAQVVERAIALWPDVQTWTIFGTVTMSDNTDAYPDAQQFPLPLLCVKRTNTAPTVIAPSSGLDEPEPAAGDDPTGTEEGLWVFGKGKLVSRRFERTGQSCPGVLLMKLDDFGRTEAICHTAGYDPASTVNLPYGHGPLEDSLGLGVLSFALTPEEYNDTSIFYTIGADPKICSAMPTEIWRIVRRSEFWSGTVVLSGEDPPGLFSIRPNKWLGLNLNLEASPIQSVEFDIGLGLTTIETGWPSFLDPHDLASLVRANRYWRYNWGQVT